MPKPKLTKTQLEDLSRMKASTYYGDGGYAYVEVDNRGWKPYTTRPVQALLKKGIITIPKNENRSFYGRVESMEAYIVHLNPIAWEYPFKYDDDKSLSQVGDKIVENTKIKKQEDARMLQEKRDYDNLTEAEVYRQLFGAEERKKCPECEAETVGSEEVDYCGPCGEKGHWGEGEPVPCPECGIITSDTDLIDYSYTCGESGDWYETEGNYAAESSQRTYYREGQEAAKAVFTPDLDEQDSFGQMDSEYMIYFELTPEEMVRDIEVQTPRYNQFAWGWSKGWDEATFDHLLTTDDSSESTMESYNQSAESYVPGVNNITNGVILVGAAIVGVLSLSKIRSMKKAETFKASQSCIDDESCEEGFVCVDGECLKTCKGDGDCASWQECRDDIHHTENVCGEDKTDSTVLGPGGTQQQPAQNQNNMDDAPTTVVAPSGMTITQKVAISGGVVGVAAIGFAAMQNKKKGKEES